MNKTTVEFDTNKEASQAFARIVEKEKLIIATRGKAAWSSALTMKREGLTITLSSGYFQENTMRNMF